MILQGICDSRFVLSPLAHFEQYRYHEVSKYKGKRRWSATPYQPTVLRRLSGFRHTTEVRCLLPPFALPSKAPHSSFSPPLHVSCASVPPFIPHLWEYDPVHRSSPSTSFTTRPSHNPSALNSTAFTTFRTRSNSAWPTSPTSHQHQILDPKVPSRSLCLVARIPYPASLRPLNCGALP